MKNVTNSLYVQMFYMLGMGAGFLFMPNVVLPMFGLQTTTEVWIRVLGALVIGFAGYYYACIKSEHVPYFKATVYGRYWFCGCLVVLAALQLGDPMLYVFAAVETSFTVWTHVALKKANLF
jgi:hypothetical protein